MTDHKTRLLQEMAEAIKLIDTMSEEQLSLMHINVDVNRSKPVNPVTEHKFYVKYGADRLTLYTVNGELTLVSERDSTISYPIDQFCLAKYQATRLSNILNQNGWFMSEKWLNGIEVVNINNSLYWRQVNNNGTVKMEHDYKYLFYRAVEDIGEHIDIKGIRKAVNGVINTAEAALIVDYIDSVLRTVMDKYDPEHIPDAILKGELDED